MSSNSLTLKNTVKSPVKPFIGRLQPVTSRVTAKPMVNFEKGGSDFRCPHNTSSIGKQVLSGTHRNTQPKVVFSTDSRFHSSATIGPGPAFLKPVSSLKHQPLSTKRSAASMNFGTSSRDGALKLYTVYTYKKN